MQRHQKHRYKDGNGVDQSRSSVAARRFGGGPHSRPAYGQRPCRNGCLPAATHGLALIELSLVPAKD
jgi:hypothetical protein